MARVRIATFNVENLFSRAKLLNFKDNEEADSHVKLVGELREELGKALYDKPRILKLYGKLKDFIEIVEVREKLFDRNRTKVVADGVNHWGGFIDFKRERFSEKARKNTAKVLRTVNADICCLVEVESRPVLRHFCIDTLPRRGSFNPYKHLMLIDGNDNRGIDVALASRLPLGILRSHIDDGTSRSKTFSRDCLEVEVKLDDERSIWMLLNHFKSKGYGKTETSNSRRKRQAKRVAEILKAGYDFTKDFVVVCGDLNDTPDSKPLLPLLSVPNLHDVLERQFPNADDRWTYHFREREQIDYLLVSKPLHDALVKAGVERRGMFDLKKLSKGKEESFKDVTAPTNSASDHGAVWADFDL